jgi:hypothetical protein
MLNQGVPLPERARELGAVTAFDSVFPGALFLPQLHLCASGSRLLAHRPA